MAKAQAVVAASPVNINKPSEVRAYVTAAMDDTEEVILEDVHEEGQPRSHQQVGHRRDVSDVQGQGLPG